MIFEDLIVVVLLLLFVGVVARIRLKARDQQPIEPNTQPRERVHRQRARREREASA